MFIVVYVALPDNPFLVVAIDRRSVRDGDMMTGADWPRSNCALKNDVWYLWSLNQYSFDLLQKKQSPRRQRGEGVRYLPRRLCRREVLSIEREDKQRLSADLTECWNRV